MDICPVLAEGLSVVFGTINVVVNGSVVACCVSSVVVILHSSMNSVKVPGTVQLNLAASA